MIKAVIVDDEACFREMIEVLLKDYFPNIQVVDRVESVQQAIQTIEEHQPDLVFLDIEIRSGTGFHVLQQLKTRNFKLIFITAYNEFAIQAIKFSAIDYILKPINEFEFKAGVERAVQEIERNEKPSPIDNLLHNNQKNHKKKLVLRTINDIYLVSIDEIIRCCADNSYTTFHLVSGEKIMVSKGIGEYADLLAGNGFFRSHQSHVVNLSYIQKIDKTDGGSIVLKDKSTIPISTRKMPHLMEELNRL